MGSAIEKSSARAIDKSLDRARSKYLDMIDELKLKFERRYLEILEDIYSEEDELRYDITVKMTQEIFKEIKTDIEEEISEEESD